MTMARIMYCSNFPRFLCCTNLSLGTGRTSSVRFAINLIYENRNFNKLAERMNVAGVIQKRLMLLIDEMRNFVRKEIKTHVKIFTNEKQFKADDCKDNYVEHVEGFISLTNGRIGLYSDQSDLDNIRPEVEKEDRSYLQRMWDNKVMDGKNKSLTYRIMRRSWKWSQILEKRTGLNKRRYQNSNVRKNSIYGNIRAYMAYGTIKESYHGILHKSERSKSDLNIKHNFTVSIVCKVWLYCRLCANLDYITMYSCCIGGFWSAAV